MWGNRIFGRCPIHYVARRGISCVSTVHLVHPPLEGYIGPQRPLWVKLALFPLAWGAKCRTLARTAAEFAVSRHDLQILKGCSGPYASRQRLIYHSAVRETEIVPGSSQREPLILSVGTIGPRKGQAILVEAFDQVAGKFPDWVLIIAGRWDDADPYSRRVRLAIEQSPYQKRIRVPGRIPDSEIRGLMQRSAIFAMPSLEEGLGLSLQEALLSGCPAVGTRAGGIPELIDHEVNGLLVEPGNVSAFAEGLARLMSNAARRAELGERARESVLQKGMTLERMIAAYARIYSQLLTTNHPTGSGRQ
jgi:glycosyltransferase involved in cell wall biosynthesis